VTGPVSALYVPGDRPDRFAKAVASGADLVIFDLEDAVAPEAKDRALEDVTAFLESSIPATVQVQVRVNSERPAEWERVAALTGVGIRMPKAESAASLAGVLALGSPVTALVENACGLEAVGEIAASGVAGLALGEADLVASLGTADAAVIEWARIRLVVAAAAAGLPAPMMGAFAAIRDLDGLERDCVRGAQLGFGGRSAVHPSQLPVIARVFSPSDADREWARAVRQALAGGVGVATLESGEMVDAAMAARATRILGDQVP